MTILYAIIGFFMVLALVSAIGFFRYGADTRPGDGVATAAMMVVCLITGLGSLLLAGLLGLVAATL